MPTCFSSAAVGAWYFYDKIETVAPVSKKATESLGKEDYDLIILDRESREVKDLANLISRDQYYVAWEFPELLVLARGEPEFGGKYLATGLGEDPLKKWWAPRAEVIYLEGKAYYGLKQAPGPAGISKLDFSASDNSFCFQPGLFSPALSGKSDGVDFMVMGKAGDETRLGYARFLRDQTASRQKIGIKNFSQIRLITAAGPKGDFSYDDAYWLEAKVGSECRGGEDGK